MEEFLEREGGKDGRLPIPEATKEIVLNAASHCEKKEKSKSPVLIRRVYICISMLLESHCCSPIDI
jgi:hypothetical protein